MPGKELAYESFITSSPISESLLNKFQHNLAEGALRIIEVNSEPVSHPVLGNSEVKISELLKSDYHGILSANPDFVQADIDRAVIVDVPESYFLRQQKTARDMGDFFEVDDDYRRNTTLRVQTEQRDSLLAWVSYLRDETNNYPDWFKVYTWESLRRLGGFDREKGLFKRRNDRTVAPYPELNPEALSLVYDEIVKYIDPENANNDTETPVGTGNFAKLYAYFLEAVNQDNKEALHNIEGSWMKYDQIDSIDSDNPTVRKLVGSLSGHNTGWCTAGAEIAADQLSKGDFYVYYSRDAEGNDTLPRIAIRMECNQVCEVRGIGEQQNMEYDMADIVFEKLKALPGGDTYFQKVEHAKRLSSIEERAIKHQLLRPEDILFIMGWDGPIQSFGYEPDPRIKQLYYYHVFYTENYSTNDSLRQVLALKSPEEILKYMSFGEIVDAKETLEELGITDLNAIYLDRLRGELADSWSFPSNFLDKVGVEILYDVGVDMTNVIQTLKGGPSVSPEKLSRFESSAREQYYHELDYFIMSEFTRLVKCEVDPVLLVNVVPARYRPNIVYRYKDELDRLGISFHPDTYEVILNSN